jgi:hypothetical protein
VITRRPPRDVRGAAAPTVVLVVLVAVLAVAGVARVGDASLRRARADAVADVTALAAVRGGRDAAVRVATASGAQLQSFRADADGTVTVRVERAGASAAAAAAPLGDLLVLGAGSHGDPEPGTGRR